MGMYRQQVQAHHHHPGPAHGGVAFTAEGQPVPVRVRSPSAAPAVYYSYRTRCSTHMGVCLMVTGVLATVLNIVAIHHKAPYSFLGHGIWGGALMLVTGMIGVVASRKTRCTVIAFMVLSIISAAFAGAMFGLSLTCASIHTDVDFDDLVCMLMAAVAFAAGIFAISGSTIGCKAICCDRREDNALILNGASDEFAFSDQSEPDHFVGQQDDEPGGYTDMLQQLPQKLADRNFGYHQRPVSGTSQPQRFEYDRTNAKHQDGRQAAAVSPQRHPILC